MQQNQIVSNMHEKEIAILLAYILKSNNFNQEKPISNLTVAVWEKIISASSKHGLTPLLFRAFEKESAGNMLPDIIYEKLKKAYLGNYARGTRLSAELRNVLWLLKENNVKPILLKGAHLAEEVYKDWGLRPMSDIDLLIRKEDLDKASEALKSGGYMPSKAFDCKLETEFEPHLPVFSKKGGFYIELHWTLEHPSKLPKIDLEGIWQRSKPLGILWPETFVMSKEDLILSLCIHIAHRHRFDIGLIALFDLYETIDKCRDSIKWEELLERAKIWGITKSLLLSLILADEFFGIKLDNEVSKNIQNAGLDKNMIDLARHRILTKIGFQAGMSENLSKLMGEHPFREKLRVFWKSAFPSQKKMASFYGLSPSSMKVYIYYPVRIKDLFSKYGGSAFSLFKKDKKTLAKVSWEEDGNKIVMWLNSS